MASINSVAKEWRRISIVNNVGGKGSQAAWQADSASGHEKAWQHENKS